jgi:hypothetical protein
MLLRSVTDGVAEKQAGFDLGVGDSAACLRSARQNPSTRFNGWGEAVRRHLAREVCVSDESAKNTEEMFPRRKQRVNQ